MGLGCSSCTKFESNANYLVEFFSLERRAEGVSKSLVRAGLVSGQRSINRAFHLCLSFSLSLSLSSTIIQRSQTVL